jgi:hypothetical protein
MALLSKTEFNRNPLQARHDIKDENHYNEQGLTWNPSIETVMFSVRFRRPARLEQWYENPLGAMMLSAARFSSLPFSVMLADSTFQYPEKADDAFPNTIFMLKCNSVQINVEKNTACAK